MFIFEKRLKLLKLQSSVYWSDTGTYKSLIKTSNYFYELENITHKKFSCPEIIAYENGYIDKASLEESIKIFSKSSYGEYLQKILDFENRRNNI